MTPYEWQTRASIAQLLGVGRSAVAAAIKSGAIETRCLTTSERVAILAARANRSTTRGPSEFVRVRPDLVVMVNNLAMPYAPCADKGLITFEVGDPAAVTAQLESLARRCLPSHPCARVVIHLDGEPTEVKPVAPTLGADDVRRLQAALSEASMWIGNVKGASVVERELNERIDELEARLRKEV